MKGSRASQAKAADTRREEEERRRAGNYLQSCRGRGARETLRGSPTNKSAPGTCGNVGGNQAGSVGSSALSAI